MKYNMKVIKSDDINWNLNKDENVYIGFSENLVFGKDFDIVHAKLKPNQELKKHYHNRPNNGHELFFLFKGGHFILKTKDKEEEIKTNKPVYIYFANNDIHGMKNISDKDLEFQLICCPNFKPGEVIHVE